MKPILIYAGTTEGRRLAECLAGAGIPCVVSVATEYGRQTMPQLSGVKVREGRMDVKQMRALALEYRVLAVVDATHPFAAEATKNIRESVEGLRVVQEDGTEGEIPYLRLLRDMPEPIPETNAAKTYGKTGNPEDGSGGKAEPVIRWFADSKSCARALAETGGNILLTTGSKELSVYAADEHVRERLYVRVLPGAESLAICEHCGIPGKQIIAMQGPFSQELNEALIRQFDIRILVTKESGAAGGYPQKLAAAENTGIQAYVIGSPDRAKGDSFAQVIRKLEGLTGKKMIECIKEMVEIDLLGIGMGGRQTWTLGAAEALERADYVFGASRMIAEIPESKHPMPYYLAKDIIPKLEQIRSGSDLQWRGGIVHVAILFSGDTGFYSGCSRMRESLLEVGYTNIRIRPGISSVAYMAAACGTSWQDASVLSVHGKGDSSNWLAEALESIRYHEKTFLIVSGAGDIRALGKGMTEWGLEHCRIQLGYQLSYPEEKVLELTPKQCENVWQEGLYICLVQNFAWEKRMLTQGLPDAVFIRDKVPMTKEEIRETIISKLHLKDKDVVYDIGSGTGSIAVEIAARSAGLRVYAIEKKPLALELIRQNRRKHGVANLQVIEGEAPEALEALEVPDCAFIGGTNGKLQEILTLLYQKNPDVRVVLTAISLETVGQLPRILWEFGKQPETIQMHINRAKKMGEYHLMQAENPVYIVTLQ